MTGRRVLVTGATGFIGGHLARELRSVGARGASRRPPAAHGDGGIDWVAAWDPANVHVMARALEGVDTMVHAAGRAHVLREESSDPLHAFREANVEGTRLAVRAAAIAGVRRVILLSSISVYGEGGTRGSRPLRDAHPSAKEASEVLRESTPLSPTTPYGISRLEAEDAASAEAAAGGLELVILRLPMVYGPFMKGNPLRLFDLVHGGRPIPLGAIHNARSTLFVGNVVFAARRLLDAPLTPRDAPLTPRDAPLTPREAPPDAPLPASATFLVADEGTVSTPGLVREIASALGRPARLWSVPLPLLRAASAVGTRLAGARFPLNADALDRLSGSLVVDASKLAGTIGVAPFTREAGLRATAEWYLGTH